MPYTTESGPENVVTLKVVGVSGASGAPLALRLLRRLRQIEGVQTHLVLSRGAELTVAEECSMSPAEFRALADVSYDETDIGAAIASGSFATMGMIVLPCSMKTVAGIAHGYSDNLLLRAADVTIKEQRKLILVPRECPLSRIHLDNMAYLAAIPGVFVMPPVLSYYHHPRTLAEMERQLIGRILVQFGLNTEGFTRWGEKEKET